MKKRALSLFLALVMLVLAVPVFALPTLATEAQPANILHSSSMTDNRPTNSHAQDGSGPIVYPGAWPFNFCVFRKVTSNQRPLP